VVMLHEQPTQLPATGREGVAVVRRSSVWIILPRGHSLCKWLQELCHLRVFLLGRRCSTHGSYSIGGAKRKQRARGGGNQARDKWRRGESK
jgi:hypothetical protein